MPSAISHQPIRAILFDLFGTVVQFAAKVPAVQGATPQWRAAMQWLEETARQELPALAFNDLLAALLQVSEEIVRQRPPEYWEVPSRERFGRALLRLGVDAGRVPEIAERLSLAHMSYLAAATALPDAHAALLQQLSSRYRLGLISNFDHAATAKRILADHGLSGFFDVILISDEFGRRKPHRAIFDAALEALGVTTSEALFVGDSIEDDVIGAHGLGLPVVWLNAKGKPLAAGVDAPRHVISTLGELTGLLG